MEKILLLQPAFLGDVILATALIEKLISHYPTAEIDFLVKKGNESILKKHPKIRQVLTFDRKNKWKSLGRLKGLIRAEQYDLIVNPHRHFSSGWLSTRSGAKQVVGFRQNPFSLFYQHRIQHSWKLHETSRNQQLIAHLTDEQAARPKLYPTASDWDFVQAHFPQPYVSISPASIWPTKQLPLVHWARLINQLPSTLPIYLLGGPADRAHCKQLQAMAKHPVVQVLAGQYGLLKDAALMARAQMNYVLDSAPLHICSAMNAPVTAIYCSTSPNFGFGPLSDQALVIETSEALICKPCGSHGKKKCPKGHFNCGNIQVPFKHFISNN